MQLRDEIPEPLVDALASNTRIGDGGLHISRLELPSTRTPRSHASLELTEMLLASLHFFCSLASGVPIRAQLSPSVAEQRRWSCGPRVADFNNPLVCRVLRGSAKKFVILGSRQTFGGFRVDHKSTLVGRR